MAKIYDIKTKSLLIDLPTIRNTIPRCIHLGLPREWGTKLQLIAPDYDSAYNKFLELQSKIIVDKVSGE